MRHRCRQVDTGCGHGLGPSALGHLIALEVRREAEVAAPPPEDVVLDRASHLSGDLECREQLPACPPVLGYAGAWSVADADFGGAESGVCDEVDECGGVSLQLA